LPQEWFALLIHTWLQPGEARREINQKPFKRFPNPGPLAATWLKPGVNETYAGTRPTLLRQSRAEVL